MSLIYPCFGPILDREAPDFPGDGRFMTRMGAGMDQQCFLCRLESIWGGLEPIGCGRRGLASFGHFWPFLAIGDFGTENFSNCEKSALYF